MSESKQERQATISTLIDSGALGSQEELAELLAARGFMVTQATISRDLEQLGAFKVRRNGRSIYALPDLSPETGGSRLDAIVRDWVNSVQVAVNLVVMKTPAGSAHLVGVAVDEAELPEVVGTICGDDTIFLACRSAADAERIADRFAAR